MKRLVPIVLALALLTGCGDNTKSPEDYPQGTWKRDYAEMYKGIHGEYPDHVPSAAEFAPTKPAPKEPKAKPKLTPKPNPAVTSSGAKLDLSPKERETWELAKGACDTSVADAAADFGMSRSAGAMAVAERYARAYPDPGLNAAALMGCYAGLVARD